MREYSEAFVAFDTLKTTHAVVMAPSPIPKKPGERIKTAIAMR